MSLGNFVAVVPGLAFGGTPLVFSPTKAGAVMVGLVAAVTILCFPFWGPPLLVLVVTSMSYSAVNVGARSMVSEATLTPIWDAVTWYIFFPRLPPAPALCYRSIEYILLWLVLSTVLLLVVDQASIEAEASDPSNWLYWLLNLSIVLLAGHLLVERRNRETLITALLLGTLTMLLMPIAVFIHYRSASGMASVLTMFGYANLNTLKLSLEAFSLRMGLPRIHLNVIDGVTTPLLSLTFCHGVVNQD